MNPQELKRSSAQVARYFVLGVVFNIAGYSIYLVLTTLMRLAPLIAVTVVYASISVINYIGNRMWTFGDRDPVKKTVPKYLAAQAVGYLTNLGIMQLFYGILAFPHAYVQLLAVLLVGAELFLLSKFFVFRAAR